MRARVPLLLVSAALLAGGTIATAQTPALVKDIYPGVSATASYEPSVGEILGTSGGKLFLEAYGSDGYGLWIAEGSASPRLLIDIAANLGADVDGTFFLSVVSTEGNVLWKTDGTLAGTVPVKRLTDNPSFPARPTGMTKVGGRLFFVLERAAAGYELWVSDGTEGGTTLVTPLPPESGVTFGYGAEFVESGGFLFFTCGYGLGCGLWKSDGTTAGTVKVSVVEAPSSLADAGSTLFFAASDPAHGVELWKSDGTTAGTALVKDISAGAAGAHPRGFVRFGDGVLFTLLSDGTLWKSDGTEAGTVQVCPIPATLPLVPVGGLALFVSQGSQLMATDGTEAGTTLVKDLGASFDLYNSAAIPGALLFWVDRGTAGLELWRTNGTSAGTSVVYAVDPLGLDIFPHQATSNGSTAWFLIANTPGGLYRSDGAPEGTRPAIDPSFRPNDGLPLWLIDANGVLFFAATDGVHGMELWRSNGLPGGTAMVRDIAAGPGDSVPSVPVPVENLLYFRAFTPETGYELYRTDGTEAGTFLVREIRPGPESGYVGSPLGTLGDLLLFTTDDGVHGLEPWRSDGTPEGTFLLRDVTPGAGSTTLMPIGVLNGAFYFQASDGTAEMLWKSDGTTAGTIPVGPVGPASHSGGAIGGVLLFPGSDPVHGEELWRTDGTAAGTFLLKDINPSGSSSPGGFFPIGNRLFFWADDGVHGAEPWTTDGTAAGTVLLKDIFPGPTRSQGSRVVEVGTALFFFADDGVHGQELWKSDGTAEGTVLVRDIAPGLEGSLFIERLVAGGRYLYFTASDHVHGRELWRSDGTEAGTVRLTDLVPGIASGLVPWGYAVNRPVLERSGGRIFFTATDGTTGYELWSLPIPTGFHPVAPCRIADTRGPEGPSGQPALAPLTLRVFQVAGLCGIPSTALEVAANFTLVSPSDAGHLSLFTGGPALDGAVEVPFGEGKTRGTFSLMGLGTRGSISVFPVLPPGGSTHLVVDVTGYFD